MDGCECYIGGSYIPGNCPACLARAEHEEEKEVLEDRIHELELRVAELESQVASHYPGMPSAD